MDILRKSSAKPLILLLTFLLSCSDDEVVETFPSMELAPKPKNLNAYLTINLEDTILHLTEDLPGYKAFLNYSFPSESGTGDPTFGARIVNDLVDTITFTLGYSHDFSDHNQLVGELTKESQELAQSFFDGQGTRFQTFGFFIDISEWEYPGGPGYGHASHSIVQPESSFVTVKEYYAGHGDGSIWLMGEFNLFMSRGSYAGKSLTGEFFMEFPLCCF